MRDDVGDEDRIIEWMLWVYLSMRYVLYVMCDFDKHITMLFVTGIDIVDRI